EVGRIESEGRFDAPVPRFLQRIGVVGGAKSDGNGRRVRAVIRKVTSCMDCSLGVATGVSQTECTDDRVEAADSLERSPEIGFAADRVVVDAIDRFTKGGGYLRAAGLAAKGRAALGDCDCQGDGTLHVPTVEN